MHPRSLRALSAALVFPMLCLWGPATARATVGASGNGAQPSQTTSYDLLGGFENGNVSITENVVLNASAGPWTKELTNNQTGRSSGEDVAMVETLTNTGALPWSGWHEEVVSTTIIPGGPNKGFLFRSGSVLLQANYGSGFIPLVENVDYTLTPTLYSGPSGPGGPNMTNTGNFIAIDITLQPARIIAAGNTLKISKNIFEVFLDGDIWMPGEKAILSQYPVPEPAALLASVTAIGFAIVRRPRRGQRF